MIETKKIPEPCDVYTAIRHPSIRNKAWHENYMEFFFNSEEEAKAFENAYGAEVTQLMKERFQLDRVIFSLYQEPPVLQHNGTTRFRPQTEFSDLTGNAAAIARVKAIAEGTSTQPLVLFGPKGSGTSFLHAIANHILENTKEKTVFYMSYDWIEKLIFVYFKNQIDEFHEELFGYDVILLDDMESLENFNTPPRALFLSFLQEFLISEKPFVLAGDPSRMPQFEKILRSILPEEAFISIM